MKRIRYTKYTGDLAGDIDLEDLMQQLSDYLLDSGFQDPMMRFQELNEHTLENLKEALRQALESGSFEQQIREQLDQMMAEGDEEKMEQLIDRLVQRMDRPSDQEVSVAQVDCVGHWQALPRKVHRIRSDLQGDVQAVIYGDLGPMLTGHIHELPGLDEQRGSRGEFVA